MCALLRFRILDECDEMLNMGFKESVQNILAAAKGVPDLQTMLFSATKPAWVKSLEDSFLRKVLRISVPAALAVKISIDAESPRCSGIF